MASNSPPPNTSPAAVPPTSTAITPPPPPQPSSPPPTISPPSQPTANPPDSSTPSTPSPPPQSPVAPSSPPPQQTISPTSPPPPPSNSTSPSPPASNPPLSSPPPGPPPANSPPPPPPVTNPPTSSPPPPTSSPPPPVSNPPTQSPPPTSPPPPVFNPPTSSPPPPVSNPPTQSPPLRSPPPPVSNPPTQAPPPRSPPPPVSNPPTQAPPPRSPPPPVSNPPTQAPPPRSPPPPVSNPPTQAPPPRSPPPPLSSPPPNSPPSPPSDPPTNSPPPSNPPSNSPPPSPPSVPPQNPPPPPSSSPPKTSPPAPVAVPPSNAPPPPTRTAAPTSPLVPPPSNPSPPPPPPPPMIRLSPPPGVPVPPMENTPGNNSNPSSPESYNSPSNNGIGTAGTVAIAVAVGIIAFSLIGLVVWCLRRRKREVSGLNGVYVVSSSMGSPPSPTSDSSYTKTQSSAPLIGSGPGSDLNSPKDPGGLGNSRSLFTYEELVKAANGFSAENLLGEGGFGSVYKGYLPDGREVAIKQLKIGGGQGEREFKAEVEIISRIHHRHLVSLVGYCISDHQRLLIYEYVPNDTLYYHLHGEGRPVLDWETRVKIAAGAARGLAYLHEDCHPRIIHRDIKSSNILLDNNFEARVSDFGLAKLALDANTHVTTRVMGTFGYMAPEYASSGKLTEKSDVFSFGVVLLELITGRKPVDASQPLGDESLVEWARPLLSHALENEEFDALADPRLGKNYVESEMFRMIEAAAACVRHSAAKRPRMGQVVRAFDSLAASDLSNGMKVGESEVFHSAQQSAEIRWFQRMAFGSQNYSTDFFTQASLDSRENGKY